MKCTKALYSTPELSYVLGYYARCHSASSLFSAIFVFQKSYKGNILGIGRNKSRTSYFLPKLREDRRWDGGGPGSRLTTGGTAQPLATPPNGEASWPHLWRCPFAYKFPSTGKTWGADLFSMKHTASHHRRRCEIERIQELFPVPCRRGESLPEAFYTTMVASGVMCE
jgi:hypothetical protein